MIESIIHFSIRNKVIVGLFILALIGWGTYSLVRLPIDAIPDITNNQVQVIALAPPLAVQEVESFITAPIEVAVAAKDNLLLAGYTDAFVKAVIDTTPATSL